MKLTSKIMSLIALALIILSGNEAQGADNVKARNIDELTKALKNVSYYRDSLKFTVGMPQLAEDVVYRVVLEQYPAEGDHLSDCSYLICWEMAEREKPSAGFSAYFDGNHYRFSGQRLQEYHWDWDSIPFKPRELSGINSDGIHKTAQFADLLPGTIGEKLEKIASDSSYTVSFSADTIVGGVRCTAVRATMTIKGATASEQEYIFDAATLLPYRLHFENSPGSISEQTVDVDYDLVAVSTPANAALNEEALMAMYPDEFTNFRESNFRIENLPGTRLPSFSLPILNGDRYSHRASEAFKSPVIVALMDPAGVFNKDYIASLREAASSLPIQTEIIWAFSGTNPDLIEEQISEAPDETILISAKGFARDCGASSLPVTIIVDRGGTVRDVILGFTPTLSTEIIQKAALAND